MDRVQEQLAFLGLDDVALHRHSAEIAIDRFDHWDGSALIGQAMVCTCTGTYKSDDPSLRAA
ncbi:hypothetical protein ACFQV2_22835 [Actinokineospora soli]|uniref:Uncharacterized protein n=1 Tax=Actinokineospora soli TaxID=1048753 RepID=A0ABW2TRV0_9PSEU